MAIASVGKDGDRNGNEQQQQLEHGDDHDRGDIRDVADADSLDARTRTNVQLAVDQRQQHAADRDGIHR
jgi:hypothetical protein